LIDINPSAWPRTGYFSNVSTAPRFVKRKSAVAIDVQFQFFETHLIASLSGAVTLEGAMEAMARVVDTASERQQPSIVIDWRDVSGMSFVSTLDRFEGTRFFARLVAQMRERGLVNVRVAHVVAEYRPDAEGFSETVAANRGVDTRVTTTLEEALAWLEVT
jgi:hypothetical protein